MKTNRMTHYLARPKQRVSLIVAAIAALYGASPIANAGTLPGGGRFVGGTGTIAGNGTSLTINQSSTRGVIDWDSFSIGQGNRVVFDNGNGATLNRVTGGNLSMILGTLSASGSVYLINPQGVVVDSSGKISTGGRFVATTLDTDDTAFMKGGPLTLTGNSAAQVLNLGHIGSSGGDVFLIANSQVVNLGEISAPKGSVELAAGQTVLLQDSSTSRQVFVTTGSRGGVTNVGAIDAAQVSLQAADGNVFALSGNHSAIRATGTATRDGHVWLVADTGAVDMEGTFSAKNADGTGGTVDTVAGTFVPDGIGATVQAGKWNLATQSLTLSQPIAATLTNSLGTGTSVNVNTTQGNIDVAADLGWSGNASLTLGAYGSVSVDNGVTIRNQGAGNLTLRADASGIDNGSSVTNNGTLDWSASTGITRALYDMNGTYTAGTQLANAAWTPPDGSGLVTQMTGYKLVNTYADLQNVSQDLKANYALGKDINATGGQFTPLGNATTPFTGQFDGMGHTIDQLTIYPIVSSQPYEQPPGPTGLFGVIGTAGVARDLNITNGNADPINFTYTWSQAGLLAGINQGHIANVFVSGQVGTADAVQIGGLVGLNQGFIERSASAAYVSGGTSYIGGLVGQNEGTISQCYETGAVSGAPHPTLPAGLVGVNTGTIKQSFVAGPLSGDWQAAPGAIAGDNTGTIAADNYWNVETTGVAVGGYVPQANGLTTAQMSQASSFAGWDFGPNGAWVMPAGATHPVLRWQTDGVPNQ